MLDDTVTAQYTHTLTMTERLGGQYQCTVSNNRPSQTSASFTVQGTPKNTLDVYSIAYINTTTFMDTSPD